MTGLISTISKKVEYFFFTSMLIVLISVQAGSAYGGTGKYPFKSPGYFEKELPGHTKMLLHPVPDNSNKKYFSKPAEKKESILCGVEMQDSVVGYTKSSTNTQIYYLLTIKNTGTIRDSFNFSYTSTGTPLYPYVETVGGTPITKTPGIEPGGSCSFIIRFVVPNGSPAQTTNYTNLVATSSVCGAASADTTHLLTHLYSGKPVTGDSCDVGITKTADVGTVTAGNTITYTISLLNNLPGLANDVFVIDTLSSAVVYQSSYVSVMPSRGAYSLTYNSTTHTVQFKYLQTLGQNQPITIVIKVKPGCTAVPSVRNKVLVSSSTYDNKPTNDTSSATTVVTNAFSAPTASGVTSCYNSSATISASGAGSRTGYEWYSASTGGSLLFTGQNYITPLLNASSIYYVGYYNLDTTTCTGPRTAVTVTVKPAPVITGPSATIVCTNDAASFMVSSTGNNPAYQWQQSSNGSSWSNLFNSPGYSCVNGSTLTISSASYSMNGYQYRCNVAAEGCTNTISSSVATLSVRKSYTWLGVNTNWLDPANWCSGVPDSSCDVTILSGVTYYPIITRTASAHDIFTATGSMVTIDAGTISIFGTLTNNGTFDARAGTVNMSGSSAQTLSGSMFAFKKIWNLIDGNRSSTGLAISSTAADTLKISGSLSFGTDSSKLNTGDNINLLSTASGTANVGIVKPNNTITGSVIVDRYVNTGTNGTQHAKSWQFLSTPTYGQTIRESWMENGSTNAGYGTQVTGPPGIAAGFDLSSVAYSIKYFNPVTNNWDGVANANTILYHLNGYMLFVRGDRTVTSPFAPATSTILRSKGNLITGPTGPVNVSANRYQSVGNPYASKIDFTKITKDAGIDDKFYVWDSYLYGTYGYGIYQTLTGTNDWKPVPGGTPPYSGCVSNPTIQSGQAFFVYSTGTSSFVSQASSLSFTENCKAAGNTAVNFNRKAANRTLEDKSFLKVSLFTGAGSGAVMADGNAVAFSMLYSSKVDQNDALKMVNGGENFGLLCNGSLLAVEAREPPKISDTIFYFISNVRKQGYRLIFATENMQDLHLQPVLVDSYSKLNTPLSLTDSTFINVNFTSDPASTTSGRFKVVFRELSPLSLTFISFNAVSTPGGIFTRWKTVNEEGLSSYEIQYSTDGMHFEAMGNTLVNPENRGNYSWLAGEPRRGNNYYRVRTVDASGRVTFSPVARINIEATAPGISVSPNPVINGALHLHFAGEPEGTYQLRLLNSSGQTVYGNPINFSGGKGTITINNGNLPKGIYHLEITRPVGKKEVIRVFY